MKWVFIAPFWYAVGFIHARFGSLTGFLSYLFSK